MHRRNWLLLAGLGGVALTVGALVASHRGLTEVDPFTGALLAEGERWSFDGEVVEVQPAGPYRYVRLASPDGERWAVALSARTGAARVRVLGRATQFSSRRLGRTFPELLFVTLHPTSTQGAGP